MDAPVTPVLTENTVFVPAPSTRTTLLNDAPRPDVGPVIVVKEGMLRVPSSKRIVFCAAEFVEVKITGSNVIVPVPVASDAASASRSVHVVPLPPIGQFVAIPLASSLAVSTT